MTTRPLLALILGVLVVAAIASGVLVATELWYRHVDPPVADRLHEARGKLVEVIGNCSSIKGGSYFALRVAANPDLTFSQRCGGQLRDQLADSIGTEMVVIYRSERQLLFWVQHQLYELRSSSHVYVNRWSQVGTISPLAVAVSMVGFAASCAAAWIGVRGFRLFTRTTK